MFRITVDPTMAAVELHRGILTRVLASGRHRRRWGARYHWVDRRSRLTQVGAQEILTADGVTVRVTATLRWRVGDPARFVLAATEPVAPVYLAVQVALRDTLASLEVVTLVRDVRQVDPARVLAAARAAAEEVGIDVQDVVVKDVLLPGDLKAAFAEQVAARQRGAAQLEAARAETAALRSLANGAALLDSHPALAQLRMIQAVPHGAQLVLRLGSADQDPA